MRTLLSITSFNHFSLNLDSPGLKKKNETQLEYFCRVLKLKKSWFDVSYLNPAILPPHSKIFYALRMSFYFSYMPIEHNAFCSIGRHERKKNSFPGNNSFCRKAENYVLRFHLYHWRSSYYAVIHVRNKNSNIQGRSPNVVKVIFHTVRNCS